MLGRSLDVAHDFKPLAAPVAVAQKHLGFGRDSGEPIGKSLGEVSGFRSVVHAQELRDCKYRVPLERGTLPFVI